jgi:hypothetical protein
MRNAFVAPLELFRLDHNEFVGCLIGLRESKEHRHHFNLK